jgi:SAM-dependent methyltransferase
VGTDRRILKQRAKQFVRRTLGEPYVGKRLKLRTLGPRLDQLRLAPLEILDAGAEDATFVYWLADRFPAARVTAVDIDADAIAACIAARPRSHADRVHFAVGSFADLDSERYDLITALDVLEHITDDHSAACDLARALKPGATMLAHVPRDRWLTRSGVEHRLPDDQAWQINPGHVRQGYSPEGLRELLDGAGLDVQEVEAWTGRWGVLAFDAYARLEHPTVLRGITIPITDACAALDRRRATPEGNTVYARAIKPRA